MIKLRYGHPRTQWALNPMTSVRKTQAHVDTQGEGHVTTEADGGAMRLQATESWGLPATAGGRETPQRLSPGAFGGSTAPGTPRSQTSRLQTCEWINPRYFKPLGLW